MKTFTGFMCWLLFVSFLFSMGRKPEWVKQRPIDNSYYIGIAMSFKEYNPDDYQEKAKEAALRDMASQIKISIQSTNIRKIVEANSEISESFTSYMQTALQADLEGYDLVDTWEDEKEYWVYFRLHKAKYEAIRRAKIEKAMSLAVDFLTRGDQFKSQGKEADAIQFYFKGLEAIEKYATEALQTEYNGKEIYLANELIAKLQQSMAGIKFRPNNPELQIKQGNIPKQPILIDVVYESSMGNETPVPNFPVKSSFTAGTLDTLVVSSTNGTASIKITSINNYKEAKQIKCTASLSKLFGSDITSPILKGVISTLTIPETTIYLRLLAATAFITGTEKNLGSPVSVLHIIPALKEAMVSEGFQFVDTPQKADFIIKIEANTVQGAQVSGLHTAFASVDVSVLDAKSYKELHREALHDIKGIQLDYRKAGLKALEQAGKDVVAKVLPQLIKNLQ
ncbi:MAG: hypothetical protein Kow00108_03590 [Calditrichia bacterium]